MQRDGLFFYCCSFRERQLFTKGGYFVLCYSLHCCQLFCSPLCKRIVYSSIVILYVAVSCSPKRGTSWAKGRGQRKTGTKSDISLSLFPKRFPSLDSPFPQPFFPYPLSDFDCAPQNTYVFALIQCENCCFLLSFITNYQHSICAYDHKCRGARPRAPSAGLRLKAKVGKKRGRQGERECRGKTAWRGGEMPTFTAVLSFSPPP